MGAPVYPALPTDGGSQNGMRAKRALFWRLMSPVTIATTHRVFSRAISTTEARKRSSLFVGSSQGNITG